MASGRGNDGNRKGGGRRGQAAACANIATLIMAIASAAPARLRSAIAFHPNFHY
jgi:hypothetical protein